MKTLTNEATRDAVSVSGLRKAYGKNVVLDGVDLSIREGEVFGLLGPNGAGKTTVVRILSTLIPVDAGTARILGHDLRREAGAVRSVMADLQLARSFVARVGPAHRDRGQAALSAAGAEVGAPTAGRCQVRPARRSRG